MAVQAKVEYARRTTAIDAQTTDYASYARFPWKYFSNLQRNEGKHEDVTWPSIIITRTSSDLPFKREKNMRLHHDNSFP